MSNSTLENVRINIKNLRLKLGLTQDVLSEKAGISQDYLSLIELGKRKPSLVRLIKIAKALGVEPYKLLM